MPSMEEQKMGVILGTKARKQGIAAMIVFFLFAWTGVGTFISIMCCFFGFRNAKMAKSLAPDSPVVQSAYLINNIFRWFFLIIPLILIPIGVVLYFILLLLGVITL